MIANRAVIAWIALSVSWAGAGCLEADGCETPSEDKFIPGFSNGTQSGRFVRLYFQCEFSEGNYPVDRYTFRFDIPEAEKFVLELSGDELVPKYGGQVTVFVDPVGGVTRVAPANNHYVLNFTGWDPSLPSFPGPAVSLIFEDGSYGWLPRGEYYIQVALRNGQDQTEWIQWHSV